MEFLKFQEVNYVSLQLIYINFGGYQKHTFSDYFESTIINTLEVMAEKPSKIAKREQVTSFGNFWAVCSYISEFKD